MTRPARSGPGGRSEVLAQSGTAFMSPSDDGDDHAFEIFPDDLDVIVDFYTRVLGFRLTADQRSEPGAYVSLRRDDVRTGAARRAVPDAHAVVIAAGWPLTEDIQHRP